MMMQYQFRPLDTWPGKMTSGRKSSPFRASYSDTLRLLETELRQLRATNIVIQAAVSESEIKRDGMLYERARPRHPGVVLAFDSKHGPLSYPCDTYNDWQANVRAIAMALEALRAVDRYGVTKRAEQYQGWARLPGPAPAAPMSPGEAVSVLIKAAQWPEPRISRGTLADVYRKAAAATHPDTGGDPEAFKEVQAAKERLELHFRIAG